MKLQVFLKATRINFLPATLIPFFTGVALAFQRNFVIEPVRLVLGVVAVSAAHLAGNVFNDLYDHKSGTDSVDSRRSPFFGGSKIIADGLLSESRVMRLGVMLLLVSFVCGLSIFIITLDPVFIVLMAVAALLAVGYTAPPLKLSYRMLGEIDIFVVFGVLMVMGSFYLFSGKFSLDAFLLSVPVSFLIVAVILCNEVPDAPGDVKAGKYNLVSLVKQKTGYILYMIAILLSYVFIVVNIVAGNISAFASGLVLFYVLGLKASLILKNRYDSFQELIKASGMTIMLHFFVGTGLIAATLLK